MTMQHRLPARRNPRRGTRVRVRAYPEAWDSTSLVLLFLAGAAAILLSGCFAEPAFDGKQVSCESQADCASLGESFTCDLISGLCVRPSDGVGGGTGDGGVGTDGGTGDGGTTGCATAADCVTLKGDPVCGTWACEAGACLLNCPDCVDNDGDGFGEGAGCAGPDCDDTTVEIIARASRTCYSGRDGTADLGVCKLGAQECVNGIWSGCTGEVAPGGEACNNQDDDCDGLTDEALGFLTCGLGICRTEVDACSGGAIVDCTWDTTKAKPETVDNTDEDCDGLTDEGVGGCVYVSALAGDDTTGTGDFATPVATITKGIELAAGRSQDVCVMAATDINTGDGCVFQTYDGPSVEPLRMANGVSVLGSINGLDGTPCQGMSTMIQANTPEGVLFPAGVDLDTALAHMKIHRTAAAGTSTAAAVTVAGASGAILQDVYIALSSPVERSYGVNVSGGFARIYGSNIDGGAGTLESVGVRVIGARVDIDGNCTTQGGACDQNCWSGKGILGNTNNQVSSSETYGVYLKDAPGSRVANSAVCSGTGNISAAISVKGQVEGNVITGNHIDGFGGATATYGVSFRTCNGGTPRLNQNTYIVAETNIAGSDADAVHSEGHCHPVIDNNELIQGGSEAASPRELAGVHCGMDGAGQVSMCSVLFNGEILGSSWGVPQRAVGVSCHDGACARIEGNENITGNTGQETIGVYLEETGTEVADNRIVGGCGTSRSTGIDAAGSFARLENNRIFGALCEAGAGATYIGVRDRHAGNGNELDAHSNLIDAGGATDKACQGNALAFESYAPTGTARAGGAFRSNIFRSGVCSSATLLVENGDAADPRHVQNNLFDNSVGTGAFYFDADTGQTHTTIDAMQAMGDGNFQGNLAGDPAFVAWPDDVHVTSGSAALDQGYTKGMPTTDMDGEDRNDPPDIGPDER